MKRFAIGAIGAALALGTAWRWGRREGYAHGFVIGRRVTETPEQQAVWAELARMIRQANETRRAEAAG